MNKRFVNNEDRGYLNKYFKEIKRIDLLTPEEEIELARLVSEGNQRAITTLVNANLKFVIKIAKEYQHQGLDLGDLINEGNLGLIKAATRFDHTRGFRFISYAVYWIKQSIMQALNDNSRVIRLPTSVITKVYKNKKQSDKFELENNRTPNTGEEVTNKDGSHELYEELDILPSCTSLNRIINEEGDELLDLIPNDNAYAADELLNSDDAENLKNELSRTLSILDDRERDIVELYYGINPDYEAMTLEAIGDKYHLTKERIRQIKEKAFRKLRNNAHGLFDLVNS